MPFTDFIAWIVLKIGQNALRYFYHVKWPRKNSLITKNYFQPKPQSNASTGIAVDNTLTKCYPERNLLRASNRSLEWNELCMCSKTRWQDLSLIRLLQFFTSYESADRIIQWMVQIIFSLLCIAQVTQHCIFFLPRINLRFMDAHVPSYKKAVNQLHVPIKNTCVHCTVH